MDWQREPIGGAWLDDLTASDPTGEDLDPDETDDPETDQSSGS
ncbi:hypothetical protein [Nocardioides piscis]|nr:hypothetical protein [Nocardioides piscis]